MMQGFILYLSVWRKCQQVHYGVPLTPSLATALVLCVMVASISNMALEGVLRPIILAMCMWLQRFKDPCPAVMVS